MAHWKFALFSEDTVQTSSTLSSASKSEKDSMDISCFSPPEFHSSCILENSPTRLRIWTVGGHYAENPIFNCRANKVKTSLDAIVFSLKLKFFKTFLKIVSRYFFERFFELFLLLKIWVQFGLI